MADSGILLDSEFNGRNLPVSALQALYHAVTGKTENLTNNYFKNFIVRKGDLDQLYAKLNQQLEHYAIVAGATVSVKVKFSNDENQQYSSWERFSVFDSGKTEIVSEVTIRFEFLITLPNIQSPQRYVINVDIDSKLPVVADETTSIPAFFLTEIPSLTVSIDFVDYLVAKNFAQIVEQWFHSLEETKSPNWLLGCAKSKLAWSFIGSRFGFIGVAAFIATLAWIEGAALDTLTEVAYLSAASIVIGALSVAATTYFGGRFGDFVRRSIVPAVILLTVGDDRAYGRIKNVHNQVLPSLFRYCTYGLITIALNVVASFAYAWLIK